MEELNRILRAHAWRYPKMQPCDAVKLIYQNEFGSGHLILDAEAALRRLRQEYAAITRDPSVLRREDIGNGIVRIHLAALDSERLEQLGREFIRCAASHKGSLPQFVRKLSLLRDMTQQGVFAFSPEQLDAYLTGYEQAGWPIVSHSEVYRQEYRPAYRIIQDRGSLI